MSRRGAAVLALLAGMVLAGSVPVGGLPGGLATARAAGAPTGGSGVTSPSPGSTQPPRGVDIHVATLAPPAPTPVDTLTVAGTLHNATGSDETAVHVELWVPRRAVTARADLAPDDPPHDTSCCYYAEDLIGPGAVVGALGAGQDAPFSLAVPMATLSLPGSGVYPVGIEVRSGRTGVLGRQWTWLTYLAGPTPPALPTAWLWPLAQLPDIGPLGGFTSDRLAGDLAPDGRLGALAAAAGAAGPNGRPATVTVVVDPSLLAAASSMTQPYVVTAPGGRAAPGTGTAAARRWLDQLRALAATDTVVALPYAAPDVVALTRAGLGSDVGLAQAAGRAVVAATLAPARPLDDVAVPADGLVTVAALDTLAASGATAVVLDRSALAADPVPAGRAVVALSSTGGTSLTGYLADPALTGLAAGRLAAAGSHDPTLVRQRFLAESFLAAAAPTTRGRGLVVAPPADWRDPALAGTLLSATASAPWLAPVALSALPAATTPVIRSGPVYPDEARAAELPQAYLTEPGEGVADVQRRVDGLCQVLVACTDDADVRQMRQATWRAQSALLRGRPADATARREDLGAAVDGLRAKVRLTEGATSFTLASRNSTIPVTVANDLDRQVQVRVVVTSSQASIAPGDAGVVVLEPLRQRQVTVQTDARSTGTFPIHLQLSTPAGEPYGPRQRLLARSTAYGAPALAITFGAGVVLVAALGLRGVRGLRHRLRHRLRDRRSGR